MAAAQSESGVNDNPRVQGTERFWINCSFPEGHESRIQLAWNFMVSRTFPRTIANND